MSRQDEKIGEHGCARATCCAHRGCAMALGACRCGRVFGRCLKDMHELDIALGGTGGTYLGPVLEDVPASYKAKVRSLHAKIESEP